MRQSTKIHSTTRGSHAVLPCRAAVVVPDPHLRVRDHPPPPGLDRLAVAKAEPGQQALVVLAYLRKGETFGELAAGFGVGTTTAWRYVNETVALLAARAPKLRNEPWPICEEPHPRDESVLVPLEIRTWEQAGHWVATLGPGAQLNTSHVRFDGVPAWASLDRSEHQPYAMIGVLQVMTGTSRTCRSRTAPTCSSCSGARTTTMNPGTARGPSRRGVARPASPSRSLNRRRQHSIPLTTQPPISRHHASFCPSG